jgi:hypothetical protein
LKNYLGPKILSNLSHLAYITLVHYTMHYTIQIQIVYGSATRVNKNTGSATPTVCPINHALWCCVVLTLFLSFLALLFEFGCPISQRLWFGAAFPKIWSRELRLFTICSSQKKILILVSIDIWLLLSRIGCYTRL